MRRKRFPNGYGGVTKLSGNRTNPYMAWIPQKEIIAGKVLDTYYKDVEDLASFVEGREFKNAQLEKDLKALILKHSKEELEVTKKKVPIGYYPTYEDACNRLYEYNKVPPNIDMANLTFADVWNLIKNDVMSDLSHSAYRSYDKAYRNCVNIHSKKMRTIKTSDMQKIVDEVAKASPSTQKNVLIVCKAIFNYATAQDITAKNYADFLTTSSYEKEEKSIFTPGEIRKIKDANYIYTATKQGVNTGLNVSRLMLILLYTGVRINELLAIKKEDVHIEERYIEVHGTKSKSANRIVPIHKDILELVETEGDYLVCNNKGNQLNYHSFQHTVFEKFKKDLDINHTIHETRHTFVSIATACGVNQMLLKKIVGHTTNDVTERYTHTYIESLIEQIDLIKVL